MQRLTAICVRHAWLTIAAALALTAAAGGSALSTGVAVGTDATLGANHPVVRQLDAFLKRFGGGYPIVIAYECADRSACDGALDPFALRMARTVSARLEQASFVARVSSPATTPLLVASSDQGIDARHLIDGDQILVDGDVRELALHDPLWSRTLVSTDGSVGAIVVDLESTDSEALSSVIREVRMEILPYQSSLRFHLVGEAVTFIESQDAGLASAARASVATGGMLFLTLMALVRSLSVVVASLVVIGVASAWTIGMLPLLGWQQNELTNGAATLILVIGCADCIHFAAHYLEVQRRFPSRAAALEATAGWVLAPCLLTTVTTVGAFASFTSGEVLALTQFGVMAAIGISFAFLLTFSLFPALLALLPTRGRAAQHSEAWQEVLARVADFGIRRSKLVLVMATVLFTVGVTGIPKLQVEMNIAALWGPEHPVTRAIDFVSTHLQRADRLEVELTLPEGARLEQPRVLRTIASIEESIAEMEGVGRVQSVLTLVRHVDRLLRPDRRDPSLPNSESAIAELLFLISSGSAGTLDTWLTLDQRNTRLSFEVLELSMREKAQLIEEVEHRLSESLPDDWEYVVTGPVVLAARYGQEFSRSQTNIVSVSSVLVFVMIGIYLRSAAWAALAIIPNAVALLLMFGIMGHWGMLLNFGSAIVAPIAIGIAADDTIHFLTAYSRERRSGKGAEEALRGAISGVGEAVIATAFALSLGFLSMMTSPMATVADMGLLCAIAILGATAADLLILPALVSTVASWRSFHALPIRRD
jgi:predicted RND superfamily exporter protein